VNPALLINVEEFPVSIQPLITEMTNKILESLDENIRAILVYGSAAGVNYIPGVSDINIAVIVKTLDFSILNQSLPLVQWARKHKIATPLYLTKDYILSALDVFPLEFSEIKEQHKLVFGEDVFKDLNIPDKDLRLLCEQQVKGKLLRLRQAYLEIGPNPVLLKNMLAGALSDLIPVFRQLIIIKEQKPFEQKQELIGQLARIFALDPNPFLAVYQDKSKKAKISPHQVEAHLQNFLDQLENLSRHMDSL
jgi:predicted nucleotidyltransferase